MAPISVEKILENFLHPKIKPIIGKPTYKTLAAVHLKLNTNTVLVHSYRGNEQLGYLTLATKEEVYNILSYNLFTSPENPG